MEGTRRRVMSRAPSGRFDPPHSLRMAQKSGWTKTLKILEIIDRTSVRATTSECEQEVKLHPVNDYKPVELTSRDEQKLQ